jgi:hypothetical protein
VVTFALTNGNERRQPIFAACPHDAVQELRSKARNGEALIAGDNGYRIGLFHGRTRRKLFYPNYALYERGDARSWVMAACDLIGDQSSVHYLRVAAIRQGYEAGHSTWGKLARLWHDDTPQENEGYAAGLPFDEFYNAVCGFVGYQQVVMYRTAWRREKGILRDCRTYNGQPDRNMIRAERRGGGRSRLAA